VALCEQGRVDVIAALPRVVSAGIIVGIAVSTISPGPGDKKEPFMGNSSFSRRAFIGLAASGTALLRFADQGFSAQAQSSASPGMPWRGLKVGLASYSFSKLPLDAAIKGIQRLGIEYVSIKDAHLPMKTTAAERKAVVKKFRDAGITPLSCGVITLPDDEAKVRSAFEYVRDVGVPTMVCNPRRESLPLLDKFVKEFDIKLAIHNHGPEDKVWPSPLDVWTAIQKFDERIGVCVDVGHTARCGVDPAQALRTCAARLYDVHFKDLERKGPKSPGAEVGRGVLDIRGMLEALLEIGYTHHLGLEYEKDMADPIPGAAESFGYIRGVLACMGGR
jgi:inosose dehydratase